MFKFKHLFYISNYLQKTQRLTGYYSNNCCTFYILQHIITITSMQIVNQILAEHILFAIHNLQ